MLKATTILLLLAAAAPAAAEWQSPALATRTLANRELSIPADLPEHPILLIIGFTEDSRGQTSAWSRAIAEDAQFNAAVATYQVAVIEDVPALMRGLVVRGIRKGVPVALHDRFLLVSDGTEDWEALVSYSEPDAAYLILLDQQRTITWRAVGEVSTTSLEALRKVAAELQDRR